MVKQVIIHLVNFKEVNMIKKSGAYRFYESTISALAAIAEKNDINRSQVILLMIRKGEHCKKMRHPAPIGKKRMVSFKLTEEDCALLKKKARAQSLSDTALLELFVHNLKIKISLEAV